MEELNKRESEILNFIKSETSRKGYPPSVREIGMAVGLKSSSTFMDISTALRKKVISEDPSKPRGIEILDDTSISVKKKWLIFLVGRITAGSPILARDPWRRISLPMTWSCR